MSGYEESMDALREYIKRTHTIPNETEWNHYALENGYFSSKTIGYLYGLGFNKICRKLMKKKNIS